MGLELWRGGAGHRADLRRERPGLRKNRRRRHAATYRPAARAGTRRILASGHEALRREPRLQRGGVSRPQPGRVAENAEPHRADRRAWQSAFRRGPRPQGWGAGHCRSGLRQSKDLRRALRGGLAKRHRLRPDATEPVRHFLTLVALLLAGHGTAWPQSVDELQGIIKKREAEIEGLKRRIEKLEEDASRPSDADDDEMNRALERALVQQGGMLLPPGAYELEPQASYAHWDKSRSTLRHETDVALSLRAGLPWDSQIQLRVPYAHVSTSGGSETALGDVDLSASKQFKPEGRSLPSLVGSLSWHARTGKDALDG